MIRLVTASFAVFLLLAVFLPIPATASFTFPNGNLLALNENGSNEITRTYDGMNRVTSYTEG